MDVTDEPELETLRFAADPHWFGKARGLAALDLMYRAGRARVYGTFWLYWWLGSGLGGPRSGGKIGPIRRALAFRSARKRAEHRSPELSYVRDAAQAPDGQPVAVHGKVCARAVLTPPLHGDGAIHHRVDLELTWARTMLRKFDHLVYEAACDFDLIDERGDIVRIEVARGALMLAKPPAKDDPTWAPIERLRELGGPAQAIDHMKTLELARSAAAHTRLRAGDQATVYGWKGTIVDPTVSERLDRETPTRPVLRSTATDRLLIFPG
jgi:hypothetical protein